MRVLNRTRVVLVLLTLFGNVFSVGGLAVDGSSVGSFGGGEWDASRFPIGPCPTITSFTPTSGPVGTSVFITGTNLGAVTAIKFGSTTVIAKNLQGPKNVQAFVPQGVTGPTGKITITTADCSVTSSGEFTYVFAPVITSFSPVTGKAGEKVIVDGKYFTGTRFAKIANTEVASFTVVSDTKLRLYTKPGSFSGKITVETPYGSGTSAGVFTTAAPPPKLTVPTTPTLIFKGSTVTINGTNFLGASSLTFGGVNAASFTVVNDTKITAVVGGGSNYGDIRVEVVTPNGKDSATEVVKKLILAGESHAGGIVVTTDSSGLRGLVVSATDLGTAVPWGPTYVTTGAASETDGAANTTTIIAAAGNAGSAAKLCRDYRGGGFSDWFLPAKTQLYAMMRVSDTSNGPITGIGLNKYWSSTEFDIGNGHYYSWTSWRSAAKSNPLRVRAMRVF
jgi:hypothetical protein